ncbi:MAG: tripartite tricarboxylate transporter substrate binding protein [Gemmatimonadetes bacterium]|nr:tripartite tricarboxylate transporter substrate binding protein [Gemmatimonadota bacterium]
MAASRGVALLCARGLMAGVAVWCAAGCAQSEAGRAAGGVEAYPQKPITIVSWVTPGSPTDLLARAIASVGPKYFGQRMMVLNKQGGSGAIAMGYLVKRKPDGHTLSITTSSGTVSMAAGHVPFTPEQFTFMMRIQLDPFLIAVRKDSPLNDLPAFFEYASQNPGKLSIAGFGTASAHFLAFQTLRAAAGNPDIRWIAYEGSADANVSVLGGHTNAVHTNYSVVREHIRAGTLKVVGASSKITSLPEVKTYAEQGYNFAPMHWRGVMGPAGMPVELVARIIELLEKTVADPDFVQFMETAGTEYAPGESPEAFQRSVEEELVWARASLDKLHLAPAP